TLTVKLGELQVEQPLSHSWDAEDEETVFGRTGFAVADLSHPEAARFDVDTDDGVVVTRVDPHSAAARGGVRPGDVVVKVGDRTIDNLQDYRRALERYEQGDTILLRLQRGDTVRLVGIELG
ncbi:unnamed protein product, partial [marine sediment metagenome]